MGKGSKPKFYAVARGTKPGIYTDWDTCKSQIDGFRGAKFKGFPTQELAQAFVDAHESYDSSELGILGIPQKKRKRSFSVTDDKVEVPSPEHQRSSKAAKSEMYTPTEPHPVGEDGYTIVYTDGSSRGNGQHGASAGVGVYFGHNDSRNVAERLAGPRQTNQRAELTGIIRALEGVNENEKVIVKTDSQYSIDCFTTWHQGWSRNGWKNSKKQEVENKDLIQQGLALINSRSGNTKLVKVKAHCGLVGNEAADQLANQGAMKEPRMSH